GQERDVVPDPDDIAVALAVEEVGDRGDHERPTRHPTEEEVDVDQGRPVRALEETGFHHASPCPPRPLNATSAPSPTIRAEPIDRVGHAFAQAGPRPLWSRSLQKVHFVAVPVSWLNATTPNGQADTQYRQPLQMSWLMLTVPYSVR